MLRCSLNDALLFRRCPHGRDQLADPRCEQDRDGGRGERPHRQGRRHRLEQGRHPRPILLSYPYLELRTSLINTQNYAIFLIKKYINTFAFTSGAPA